MNIDVYPGVSQREPVKEAQSKNKEWFNDIFQVQKEKLFWMS